MKRYFITGTDTDCGKTYVTCELLRYLNSKQQRAQAIKPLASGCSEHDGQLISEDVTRLQRYNYAPLQDVNNWSYEPPIAPHLAAERMGDELSATKMALFCDNKEFSEFDYLLVEGAGGLLVPLNEDETWLDFLQLTSMPVILVVGMRLGCINHALLSDYVLKTNHIPCLGWIANIIDQNMLVIDENIVTLSSRMHMPLIATITNGGGIEEISGLL